MVIPDEINCPGLLKKRKYFETLALEKGGAQDETNCVHGWSVRKTRMEVEEGRKGNMSSKTLEENQGIRGRHSALGKRCTDTTHLNRRRGAHSERNSKPRSGGLGIPKKEAAWQHSRAARVDFSALTRGKGVT